MAIPPLPAWQRVTRIIRFHDSGHWKPRPAEPRYRSTELHWMFTMAELHPGEPIRLPNHNVNHPGSTPAKAIARTSIPIESFARKPFHSFSRTVQAAALVSASVLLSSGAARAALSVSPSSSAAAMAAALLGPGVNLVPGSATYLGASSASGFFTGDTTIFGNPAGVNGVLLTTGSVNAALGPNSSASTSVNNSVGGSAYLSGLIGGTQTFDASTLTFKIKLDQGVSGVEWTYVFGSEEYNEFVNTQFNDVFALSLDGKNLALVPGTNTPVSINNVNNGNPVGTGTITNSSFYRDNSPGNNNGGVPGSIATQYDGLTTVLKSTAAGLKPGEEYTLSFAIADTGDGIYDSGVFLLGGSIKDLEKVTTQEPAPGASVPGPLPLLGVGAALGWSRRLRRRVTPIHPRPL